MRVVDFQTIAKEDFWFYGLVAHRQYWKMRNEFSYWTRPRPDNGITLILCENAVYTLKNGEELRAKAGDLLLIPQGAYYTVRFAAGPQDSVDTLLLNFRMRDEKGNPVTLSDSIRVLCRDWENVLFNQMENAANAVFTGRMLRARACFLQVLEFAMDSIGKSRTDPLLRVLDYIAEHLGETLRIPDLAQRAAVSEATLRRQFRERLGISPTVYIRRQKMERAKRMLASAELSVEDICEQLGFYDASFFYKQFKAETGISPAVFRKRV